MNTPIPSVNTTNSTIQYVPGPSDQGLWWNLGMVVAVSGFLILTLCTVVWCLLKRKPTLVTQVVKSPLLQAESPIRKRYEQELEHELQRSMLLQKRLDDMEAHKLILNKKIDDLERSFGDNALTKRHSSTVLPSALKKPASIIKHRTVTQNIKPPKRHSAPSPHEAILMKDADNKIGLKYSGTEVLSAEADSPAAQAGLRPGCIILEINQQKIAHSSEQVSEAFAKAGKFVTVKWIEEPLKLDSPALTESSNSLKSSSTTSEDSVVLSTTRIRRKTTSAMTTSTRDESNESFQRLIPQRIVKKVSLRESTPDDSSVNEEIETSFAESFYSDPPNIGESSFGGSADFASMPVFENDVKSMHHQQQLHLEGACRELVKQTAQQHSDLQRRLSDVENIIRSSPPHAFSLPPLAVSRVGNLSPSPPERPTPALQFNHSLNQAPFPPPDVLNYGTPNPLCGYNSLGALTPLE